MRSCQSSGKTRVRLYTREDNIQVSTDRLRSCNDTRQTLKSNLNLGVWTAQIKSPDLELGTPVSAPSPRLPSLPFRAPPTPCLPRMGPSPTRHPCRTVSRWHFRRVGLPQVWHPFYPRASSSVPHGNPLALPTKHGASPKTADGRPTGGRRAAAGSSLSQWAPRSRAA